MKKQLSVGLVIAGISLLIISSGFAEPTHPNEVGLYTAPNGYGETGTFVVGSPVTVYMVLTKPTDLMRGQPFSSVGAFDGQLNFNPVGGIFLLADVLPPFNTNIGDNQHFSDGYLEYIVAFYDVPVIEESVVLITFTFLNTNSSTVEVTLGPCSAPSIPGQMSFLSTDFEPIYLQIMHPVSGSHDAPVFIFNGEAVAVENESFGSVKALYR